MRVGDLVMWIGFPGASKPGPEKIGIIIKEYAFRSDRVDKRFDVMWQGGDFGTSLYPQTIKVMK